MKEQREFEFGDTRKQEKDTLLNQFQIKYEETGDPFVDAGGMALEYISKQFPDKSIMELYEWIMDIYVKRWGKNLYNIFHTNAVKKLGTQKLRDVFTEYIFEKEYHSIGFCRTCGCNKPLYIQSREFYPISGSGTLVNYHHSHEGGILLCANCSIKLLFLPLTILRIGKNLSIITGNKESEKFWESVSVKENLDKIGRNTSNEILHYKFSKIIIALFAFVTDSIRKTSNNTHNDAVTLYEFNNFGSEPFMNIIFMNNNVVRFLDKTIRNISKTWHNFLASYYKYTHFDKEKQIWTFGKDKEIIEPDKDYIDSENDILNYLISGKSIFSNMRKFYKNQINKQNEIDSRMAVYYGKEVLKMTSEQINLIKSIGTKIFDLMKEENDFKKYLVKLEGASKAYQLRSALINIIKKNYASGNEETLVTLDEWVNYLFPDGQYWGEVRDLLLIFLYEKLHENNMQIDIDENVQVKETEENNTEF